MRYLAKNIYRERCIATNSNNPKFIAKYVYCMHGKLRNTQEYIELIFFLIYTQSYMLFVLCKC